VVRDHAISPPRQIGHVCSAADLNVRLAGANPSHPAPNWRRPSSRPVALLAVEGPPPHLRSDGTSPQPISVKRIAMPKIVTHYGALPTVAHLGVVE
jgi:hypothetical protein